MTWCLCVWMYTEKKNSQTKWNQTKPIHILDLLWHSLQATPKLPEEPTYTAPLSETHRMLKNLPVPTLVPTLCPGPLPTKWKLSHFYGKLHSEHSKDTISIGSSFRGCCSHTWPIPSENGHNQQSTSIPKKADTYILARMSPPFSCHVGRLFLWCCSKAVAPSCKWL